MQQAPLHGAAFWGWNKVVEYLLSKGADINLADSRGFTAVDYAMGRAGGNSRGGQRIDVHKDTADLIASKGGIAGTPASRPAPVAVLPALASLWPHVLHFRCAWIAMEKNGPGVDAHEPSFTAMWCAWARNIPCHGSPFSDLLRHAKRPIGSRAGARSRVASAMGRFSQEAADALILLTVVRHRVLADRLPPVHQRGVRQLVILGAGLDTTGFGLPEWGDKWRVFEVDHPATQEWKRRRITDLGWEVPANHVFAPCDFEQQSLLSALTAAGFERQRPALVSLFGVIIYLTANATRATLTELATLAPGSEVI